MICLLNRSLAFLLHIQFCLFNSKMFAFPIFHFKDGCVKGPD